MDCFIYYRNEQGVLPRILAAVTQRGILVESMSAGPAHYQFGYVAVLDIEITSKQGQQLRRQWMGIVGVTEVKMA